LAATSGVTGKRQDRRRFLPNSRPGASKWRSPWPPDGARGADEAEGAGRVGDRRPKNWKSRRVVPLDGWLVDDLRAYLDTHPRRDDPEAPLFPGAVRPERRCAPG
jgi:hypothetical protein